MTDRPLITFALFAYNQEQFIREAVEGAFSQTYSPLEIILSDDCSIDSTFEIMRSMVETYCGPHIVRLNRNNINLGLIGHVNKIFEIVSGELIVVAAGDDISLPNRTSLLVDAYINSGCEALVIHSDAIKIDNCNVECGIFVPQVRHDFILEEMAVSQSIYIGATGAWNRKICREFGGITFTNAYEDLVFGFRAALRDLLVYVESPLVKYRFSSGITARNVQFRFDFPLKISKRIRKLKVLIDVYEQRIVDVENVRGLDIDKKENLKRILLKQIKRIKISHAIYCEKLQFRDIFSKKNILVFLKSLMSEIKYLFR